MGKRGAVAAAALPAWKRHQGGATVKAKISAVVAALEDDFLAGEATEVARRMLAAGAPKALADPIEKRHLMQTTVVSHIREALLQSASKLEAWAADARRAAEGAASEATGIKAESDSALDAAVEATKDLHTKKAAYLESTKKTVDAKKDLHSFQQSQQVLAEELQALEKERLHYRHITDGDLKALLEQGSEAPDAKAVSKRLVKELEKLGAEAALQIAIPAALLKKPEERKGFDAHVLQSCQDLVAVSLADVAQRIEAKNAEIAEFGPTLKEKTEAAEQAEAAEAAANKAEVAAEETLSQRQESASQKDSEANAAETNLQEKEKAAAEAAAEVAAFQEIVDCLEFLASRTNIVPAADEEAEQAEQAETNQA